MKTNKVKKEVLDCLRKNPIIQNACDKNNISRQTLYRWRNNSSVFREQMDKAIEEGNEFLNDFVENKHISLINEKNWQAIKYHLDKKYFKHKTLDDRNSNGGKLSIVDLARELEEEEENEKKLIQIKN